MYPFLLVFCGSVGLYAEDVKDDVVEAVFLQVYGYVVYVLQVVEVYDPRDRNIRGDAQLFLDLLRDPVFAPADFYVLEANVL